MRQIRRTGLVTVMVTGGALAAAGAAHADAGARGDAVASPGLLSGNSVQAPVHVPVNVCGNTVNVVGLLNPAVGNGCANGGTADGAGAGNTAEQSDASGATAEGSAGNSPGVLSGNTIQVPVDVPVNVTGNSVNVVGIGNPAVGNASSNTPGTPPAAPEPAPPLPPAAPAVTLPAPLPGTAAEQAPPAAAQLAHTGAPASLGLAVPAAAAMVLGGAVLYRRRRSA
ncbi:chaplin [Streptomyces sp. NPDC059176]|uniref:chaplin n=1 Tax=unclassified Streptomyces TaxID=2593676 RepID=UPI00369C92E0